MCRPGLGPAVIIEVIGPLISPVARLHITVYRVICRLVVRWFPAVGFIIPLVNISFIVFLENIAVTVSKNIIWPLGWFCSRPVIVYAGIVVTGIIVAGPIDIVIIIVIIPRPVIVIAWPVVISVISRPVIVSWSIISGWPVAA